jgi:hypothetical protein
MIKITKKQAYEVMPVFEVTLSEAKELAKAYNYFHDNPKDGGRMSRLKKAGLWAWFLALATLLVLYSRNDWGWVMNRVLAYGY